MVLYEGGIRVLCRAEWEQSGSPTLLSFQKPSIEILSIFITYAQVFTSLKTLKGASLAKFILAQIFLDNFSKAWASWLQNNLTSKFMEISLTPKSIIDFVGIRMEAIYVTTLHHFCNSAYFFATLRDFEKQNKIIFKHRIWGFLTTSSGKIPNWWNF